MKKIFSLVSSLVNYAIKNSLIEEEDKTYATNSMLSILNLHDFEEDNNTTYSSLEKILCGICDYAYENKLIEKNTVVYRDLFDTKLMGILTPRPSEVTHKFNSLLKNSPYKATEYFYLLAKSSNYIRTYRIEKDIRWVYDSDYGKIDITINLSKPEKDPEAIAAAKLLPQSGYPKCPLCHENEGFEGDINHPARQNLRQIPMKLANNTWFLQYSPYVYYNEHCIVLSKDHVPMAISRATFEKTLDFIDILPHYFIGSNADLPIVGGSILSHDHMQGGHYTFAMATAPDIKVFNFKGFSDVRASLIKWPLSVIRLRSANKQSLCILADKILSEWRAYTDEDAFIFAETEGEPHNTITPIARRSGNDFELDLVLRNNITTAEHPLGVYHPHSELHNIKKENIGLIEVMGLAVLPSRLKEEMKLLAQAVLNKEKITDIPEIEKHAEWFSKFADKYEFKAENIDNILKHEIGATFVKVLEDAGVYKQTPESLENFCKFVRKVGGNI